MSVGLRNKPTRAGVNNLGGYSKIAEKLPSFSLSGTIWSLLSASLQVPSSSLQIIFFCFSISIHKTGNGSCTQAMPILLSQPLTSNQSLPLSSSYLRGDSEPPRLPDGFRFAQVSILGGGQSGEQGCVVQREKMGLKVNLLAGCGKGSRDGLFNTLAKSCSVCSPLGLARP